eukprot:454294-Amphidinium_carterae.1
MGLRTCENGHISTVVAKRGRELKGNATTPHCRERIDVLRCVCVCVNVLFLLLRTSNKSEYGPPMIKSAKASQGSSRPTQAHRVENIAGFTRPSTCLHVAGRSEQTHSENKTSKAISQSRTPTSPKELHAPIKAIQCLPHPRSGVI